MPCVPRATSVRFARCSSPGLATRELVRPASGRLPLSRTRGGLATLLPPGGRLTPIEFWTHGVPARENLENSERRRRFGPTSCGPAPFDRRRSQHRQPRRRSCPPSRERHVSRKGPQSAPIKFWDTTSVENERAACCASTTGEPPDPADRVFGTARDRVLGHHPVRFHEAESAGRRSSAQDS